MMTTYTEKIEHRGYVIHLLGLVECVSNLVWEYGIYNEAGEKVSYGGYPSSSDKEIAIEYAKNWVDEFIHDNDPQEPDVDDSLPEWANYYPNESDYIAEF